MVLIIPTVPIVHGQCARQISIAPALDVDPCAIYSEDPIDRVRLLRKENAKTIHLEFWDSMAWDEESLRQIDLLRAAVDIPFELALSEFPEDCETLDRVFEHGIYRVFLPLQTPFPVVEKMIARFGGRKVVPTYDLTIDTNTFNELAARRIERIGLEISSADALETDLIDWTRLSAVAQCAFDAKVRMTALHGIKGYPDLRKLQDLNPALDSLVLSRALNENRFPCQLLWREIEAEYALEAGPSMNLWTNPLEGRPHL